MEGVGSGCMEGVGSGCRGRGLGVLPQKTKCRRQMVHSEAYLYNNVGYAKTLREIEKREEGGTSVVR